MPALKYRTAYFRLMFIDAEERRVASGDAVFIPSGSTHGIRNVGSDTLVYLTANRAFGIKREKEIWPMNAPGSMNNV